MRPNPEYPADLLTFTEEILNGKLHFSCSDKMFCSTQKFLLTDYGLCSCFTCDSIDQSI